MHAALDGNSVGDWLGNAKAALDLLKAARGIFPQGEKRDALDARISAAEEALSRSDAALAKQLGFQLCQCTFPPQIMLWREADRAFVCANPECGAVRRPPAPASKAIPLARICPLCEGEMKVVSERGHPHFSFAGLKVHMMKCTQCDHETSRDFEPGKGYR